MSFDPTGYSDDINPPRRPRLNEGGDEPPTFGPNRELARNRLMFPAILMLVLAILDLLASLFQCGYTGYVAALPAKDVQEMMIRQFTQFGEAFNNPQMKKDFDKQVAEMRKQDPSAVKSNILIQNVPISLVSIIVSILCLWGSVNMMRVKGFGLAMTGAVLTIIPCISIGGCCCGLGQVVGIWSLVVLLAPEVKAAFQ